MKTTALWTPSAKWWKSREGAIHGGDNSAHGLNGLTVTSMHFRFAARTTFWAKNTGFS